MTSVLTSAGAGPSELMGVSGAREKAQADQSMFSVVFAHATRDKQAAAIQQRLAAKDIRLSQSLSQAASSQAADGAAAGQKLTAAVRRKTKLLGSVHRLSAVLGEEERDLNFATHRLSADSRSELQLRAALPELHRAEQDLKGRLARVERGERRARKGEKVERAEEKKAKQVLRQALRAYNNYAVKGENAEEREHFATSKAGLLKAKALVAARKSRLEQTTALADASKAPAKAKQLKIEAANENAKASLLRAQASESTKSAQVWDAKAKEAASYMKMMKADVHAAEQRVLRKESTQRQRAKYRLAQRQLELELRQAEGEERKGDIAQARLLRDAVQNKGVVAMGIKDVKRTREGLAQAMRGVEQEQQGALGYQREETADSTRMRVDEEQAQALHFAAAEHQVAADHLMQSEKAAAEEAKGLMHRAKDLLTFATEDKEASAAAGSLRRLDTEAESLAH